VKRSGALCIVFQRCLDTVLCPPSLAGFTNSPFLLRFPYERDDLTSSSFVYCKLVPDALSISTTALVSFFLTFQDHFRLFARTVSFYILFFLTTRFVQPVLMELCIETCFLAYGVPSNKQGGPFFNSCSAIDFHPCQFFLFLSFLLRGRAKNLCFQFSIFPAVSGSLICSRPWSRRRRAFYATSLFFFSFT